MQTSKNEKIVKIMAGGHVDIHLPDHHKFTKDHLMFILINMLYKNSDFNNSMLPELIAWNHTFACDSYDSLQSPELFTANEARQIKCAICPSFMFDKRERVSCDSCEKVLCRHCYDFLCQSPSVLMQCSTSPFISESFENVDNVPSGHTFKIDKDRTLDDRKNNVEKHKESDDIRIRILDRLQHF